MSVRECKILALNPVYWCCMIVAPVIITIFLTSLLGEGLPQEMPVGIVDNDNTTMTRKLTRTLDSFQSSRVVAHYPNVDEARQAMQKGTIYGFMYFPKGTTDDLLASRQPKVSFYYNSTSLTAGSLVFKDMKTMCTLAGAAVGMATLQAKGIPQEMTMAILQPVTIQSHNIGNPWGSYDIYLCSMFVPGIILLFVFLITSYSFGTEQKFGTNKELMETSGDNVVAVIIGKLLPQFLIFFLVLSACLTYMYGILHYPAPGGMGRLYMLAFLAVLGCQGLAMFIFCLMPSLRLSLSICSLWSVLSFSMVGSAFPVFAMDKPLEMLSYLFPLRHYYKIFQLCIFNDFPLCDVSFNICMLLIFAFLPWLLCKRLGFAMRYYTYMQ